MRARRLVAAALACALLAGIAYPRAADSTITHEVVSVEAVFGALAAGSTVGANATNASVSVVGALLTPLTTQLVWLNNTNASGVYYARLALVASSGLADVSALSLSLDNGTATSTQATIASGSVTQSTGAPMRLDAGASGRIAVTQTTLGLGLTQSLLVDVYLSDAENESSYSKSRLAISLL